MVDDDVEVDVEYVRTQAGSPVALLSPEGTAVLELDLAEPADHRVDGAWESFNAVFTGPAEPVLEQDSYRVRFGDGREAWIFLVPESATPPTYVASFNREVR